MNIEKDLVCPKCHSIMIEREDCYDISTYPGNRIGEQYVGYCLECKTPLQWVEFYKFEGFSLPEADEEK